jgi:hypothetical protein
MTAWKQTDFGRMISKKPNKQWLMYASHRKMGLGNGTKAGKTVRCYLRYDNE